MGRLTPHPAAGEEALLSVSTQQDLVSEQDSGDFFGRVDLADGFEQGRSFGRDCGECEVAHGQVSGVSDGVGRDAYLFSWGAVDESYGSQGYEWLGDVGLAGK